MNPTIALHLVEAIASIGVVVASMELLSWRHLLRNGHLLSWRIHRLTLPRPVVMFVEASPIRRLFTYPGVLLVLVSRCLFGIALVTAAILQDSTLIPLTGVIVTSMWMTVRSSQGNDGSDQQASILLTAALLGEVIGTTFAREAVLVFIAVETCLAYATSGLLKVLHRGWRDGTSVLGILSTASYGNRRLYRLFKRFRPLPRVIGRVVAFGDSLLALAVLVPPPICVPLMFFGLMLHGGIAVVMGLNVFIWSFTAAYPAIYWTSATLWGWLL